MASDRKKSKSRPSSRVKAGENRKRKRALVVLGAHRSGTSAAARVVNLLGLSLGFKLLPPRPDNPLGFWEHAGVMSLHERALAALGSTWDDIRPLPEVWWRLPQLDAFRDELRELLRVEFAEHSVWAVKDPRVCRLFPLWKDLLAELDVDPCFLLVVRNPNEVAASLAHRNGFPFWKSHLLWLRDELAAEQASASYPRSIATYEQLLADWRGVMERVGHSLALSWPAWDETTEAAIDEFLAPSLRHHRAVPPVNVDPSVPSWVREVYSALVTASEDGEDGMSQVLARVSSQLRASDEATRPWIQSLADGTRDATAAASTNVTLYEAARRELESAEAALEHECQEAARSSGRLVEARDAAQRAQEKVEEQAVALERLVQDRGRVERELEEVRKELREADALREEAVCGLAEERVCANAATSELATVSAQLAATNVELATSKQKLADLLESRSWKLTAPLRSLKEFRRWVRNR